MYSEITVRGTYRTDATSKMERFVIIVNGWKTLTIITKPSILNDATVLDPPLKINKLKTGSLKQVCGKRLIINEERLIDLHFPRTNKFHEIFNRNIVKVNYSCLPNFA